MAADDKGLALAPPQSAALKQINEELELIKKAYAPGVTPMDFERFIAEAAHLGLDPVLREIWAIPGFGKDKDGKQKPAIIMPSINGYRKLADITGLVDGTVGPEFCGDDAKWVDVWLQDKPPAAARFSIFRKDRKLPTVATVTFRQRAKHYPGGGLMGKWAETSAEMLGINAERDCWKRSGLIHNGAREFYADPEKDKADGMRRVHAAGATADVSHDQIRSIVQSFNPAITSLTEATADDLHMAADLIEAVGPSAVPTDPSTGELIENAAERAAFLTEMQRVAATNSGDEWRKLMGGAGTTAWKWQILIENATNPKLARALVDRAIDAGVPELFANGCLQVAMDRMEQAETAALIANPVPTPEPAAESTDASPEDASEAQTLTPVFKDWAEFYHVLKARGLDAGAFEAFVGKPPAAYGNPTAAMAALIQAEAELDGILGNADEESADVGTAEEDGSFRELDGTETP